MHYKYKTIGKIAFSGVLFVLIFSGCLPWGQNKDQAEEVTVIEEFQEEPINNELPNELFDDSSTIETKSIVAEPAEPNEILEAVSAQALQEAVSRKSKVVVDFYAPWCGPCKAMYPVIKDLAENENNGILFVTADVDKIEMKDLMLGDKLVDVRSIPTLYLFKEGKFVTALYGGMNKNMLIERLNRHF